MSALHPTTTTPALTALLALALALLAAACSVSDKNGAHLGDPDQAGQPGGPVRIVLWHSYREAEQDALNQSVALFNKTHTDVQIDALQIPHEAYADKLTAAIPRGNGPDLFIFAHDRIGAWAESDLIEPVSAWADTAYLRSFERATVLALVYKKALYGLPLAFKSVLLFYNTALVPEPPRTDADLLAIARRLSNPDERRYGLVYENTQLYFTAPFIHGFGGAAMDMDGNVKIGSDEAANGLRFCRQLVAERLVPDDVNSNLVTTLFNTGKAAMVINGPWFRGEIAPDVRWAVAPLPTITATGKPAAPYLGSEAVLLSRHSNHKDHAFQVMKFLTGPDSARIRMEVGGQAVAWKQTWDVATVQPDMRVFRQQAQDVVVMPSSSRMNAVWGPTNQAIHKIVKDGEDPRATVQQAQQRIEASLR